MTSLLSRARGLNRFGTDGKWYWVSPCGDASTGGWDVDPGTPAVTLVVLESLRADLRLSWPGAVEAVRQLTGHPEDPAVFTAVEPAARPPGVLEGV